jgi:hypothetical protein
MENAARSINLDGSASYRWIERSDRPNNFKSLERRQYPLRSWTAPELRFVTTSFAILLHRLEIPLGHTHAWHAVADLMLRFSRP